MVENIKESTRNPFIGKKETFCGKTELLALAPDLIIILLMLIRLLQAKK